MTGRRQLAGAPPRTVLAEQVRVSVVGARTQLDVALPLDLAVASLLPELVRVVGSRTTEAHTDSPWPEAKHTFWVLHRLDCATPLQPEQTLRAAGVVDGQQLGLTERQAHAAPTLYDDVVDAAARLNKAAYRGWNGAAAQSMSLVGMGVTSLLWVYLLLAGSPRAIVVALAAAAAAAMVGVAAAAHRWYGHADIGAAAGWSTIPINSVIVWALAARFGGYGVAAGCAALVVLNAACYWAIGTGRWGYLASGVLYTVGGLAMLSHTLGVSARTVGVVTAVAAALACLTVSRLTARLARVEPPAAPARADSDALHYENPFAPQPSPAGGGAQDSPAAAMPTAEAVWARVRSATLTGSALYGALAVSVLCGALTVLRAGAQWAAVVFAAVCAAALAAVARIPDTAAERVCLAVPATTLMVLGCLGAQRGTAALAWTGLVTLMAVAVTASMAGLRLARGMVPPRWSPGWAYLHYAVYAALIPAALWAAGVYAGIR